MQGCRAQEKAKWKLADYPDLWRREAVGGGKTASRGVQSMWPPMWPRGSYHFCRSHPSPVRGGCRLGQNRGSVYRGKRNLLRTGHPSWEKGLRLLV